MVWLAISMNTTNAAPAFMGCRPTQLAPCRRPPLEPGSDGSRTGPPGFCFGTFSLREPVSTSLENAIEGLKSLPPGIIRTHDRPNQVAIRPRRFLLENQDV